MGMTRGPRLTLLFTLALVVVTVAYRYDQYVLHKNYIVNAQAPCDPTTEQCFVSDCTPGDPGCDTSPYEKVTMSAAEAPACLEEHSCDSFSCAGSLSCSIAYCSDDTLEDGETCTAK